MNKFNPGEIYEKNGVLLLILTSEDSNLGVISCMVCVLPYKNVNWKHRSYQSYKTTFTPKNTTWKLVEQ